MDLIDDCFCAICHKIEFKKRKRKTPPYNNPSRVSKRSRGILELRIFFFRVCTLESISVEKYAYWCPYIQEFWLVFYEIRRLIKFGLVTVAKQVTITADV